MASGKEKYLFNLSGKWLDIAWALIPDVRLKIISGEFFKVEEKIEERFRVSGRITVTDRSIVIFEPLYLLDVTKIVAYVRCPRKYYLDRVKGLSPTNTAMMKGNIVHRIFSNMIKSTEKSLEELVDDAVYHNSMPIALLELSEEELRVEALNHSERLERYVMKNLSNSKYQSEKMFFSREYGIKGRIDAFSNEREPLELKTKRCSGEEPYFIDKSQLILYMLMLNRKKDVPPIVGRIIYSGNIVDLERKVKFSQGLANWLLKLRAEIIKIENEKFTPLPDGRRCEWCYDITECLSICQQINSSYNNCVECDAKDLCSKIRSRKLTPSEKKYFHKYSHLIELEKREGQTLVNKILNLPPQQRVEEGTALIDFTIQKIQKNEKGYSIFLLVENNSELREGDFVLVSNEDPCNGENSTGIIEKIGKDHLILSMRETLENMKIIDLYESDLIYNRMKRSLYNFTFNKRDYLKKIILGEAEPRFKINVEKKYIKNDISQNKAVNLALNAEDLCLIHGPPGTGKTTIITQIIKEMLKQNKKILICSYTNRALDNVLTKLREEQIENFLRVGYRNAIDQKLNDKILNDFQPPKKIKDLIEKTPILATTSTYLSSGNFEKLFFDVAIIDEAGQMVEPATLAVVNLTKKMILIGDHKQLPAVVKSSVAAKNGFQTSMFERLIKKYPHASKMLEYQYRMNQQIQKFSNQIFYSNQIKAANFQVQTQTLGQLLKKSRSGLIPLESPILIYLVEGKCLNKVNKNEAMALIKILKDVTDRGLPPNKIGVIAPYKAQIAEIRRLMLLYLPNKSFDVDTVDRFQGQEREVIIISFTESNPNLGIIFDDERRFNVALTRAKKTLISLIHPYLHENSFIKRFLETYSDSIFKLDN